MDFPEWLETEIKKRGWRPVDLASAAGQYPTTINRVLNRERNIGPDVCVAIARALKEPPEKVFRLAGLLPDLPAPENERLEREMAEVLRQLPSEWREDVLEYARWRYRQEQER